MPRLINKIPEYRRRSDGRAVVTLDGRDHCIGKHGTPESRAEYDRLISVWLAHGRSFRASPENPQGNVSISELILMYYKRAQREHTKPDGTVG